MKLPWYERFFGIHIHKWEITPPTWWDEDTAGRAAHSFRKMGITKEGPIRRCRCGIEHHGEIHCLGLNPPTYLVDWGKSTQRWDIDLDKPISFWKH